MRRQSKIVLKTDLLELNRVMSWFEELGQTFIPKIALMQCQTALAEGFTNAVRHAHRNKPPETLIEVEVRIDSQSVEIKIWDGGDRFDLEEKMQDLPDSFDAGVEGGMGLFLIKEMVNEVSYWYDAAQQRNCLLMIKKYAV